MKVLIPILLMIIAASCSTNKNLNDLDVCPELKEAIRAGWKVNKKKETGYCCKKEFTKDFSEAMKSSPCREGLTKKKLLSLLGQPSEARTGADAYFKLNESIEQDKEYETLLFTCLTEYKMVTLSGKRKRRGMTYYFLIEKESGNVVSYFNTK